MQISCVLADDPIMLTIKPGQVGNVNGWKDGWMDGGARIKARVLIAPHTADCTKHARQQTTLH